jgi:hypothetical protein
MQKKYIVMNTFKKLLLTPYDLDDIIRPHIGLQPDWLLLILEEIEKQTSECFRAHRYIYPKAEKEVYIVAIKNYREAVEQSLQFLDYGVLYLVDIVKHIKTIQSWNPNTGDPGCIVAYDDLISKFSPGKILGVDVSMGDPLFLWKECRVSPLTFPKDHYVLMEKKEETIKT